MKWFAVVLLQLQLLVVALGQGLGSGVGAVAAAAAAAAATANPTASPRGVTVACASARRSNPKRYYLGEIGAGGIPVGTRVKVAVKPACVAKTSAARQGQDGGRPRRNQPVTIALYVANATTVLTLCQASSDNPRWDESRPGQVVMCEGSVPAAFAAGTKANVGLSVRPMLSKYAAQFSFVVSW